MHIVRSFIYVDYERTFFPRFFQTIICLNNGEAISLDDVCSVDNIKENYLIRDVYKYRKSVVDWCNTKQRMIDQYSENKSTNSNNTDTNDGSDLSQLHQRVECVIKDADRQVEDLFVETQKYFRMRLSENPVLICELRDRLQSSTSTIGHLTENLETLCHKALPESVLEDNEQLGHDEYNMTMLSDVW